jgi:hypothetical protein
VKALRLLFVFAASVPERVAATVLATESAALPVVKSIGPLAFILFQIGVNLLNPHLLILQRDQKQWNHSNSAPYTYKNHRRAIREHERQRSNSNQDDQKDGNGVKSASVAIFWRRLLKFRMRSFESFIPIFWKMLPDRGNRFVALKKAHCGKKIFLANVPDDLPRAEWWLPSNRR